LENAPKNHNKKLTMAAINVHCIEFSDLILNLISDKIEQRNNASVKTRNMNLFVNDLELASRWAIGLNDSNNTIKVTTQNLYGMKPFGKFYFKIYTLCCAITNLVHKIKIRTSSNFGTEIVESEYMMEQKMNKIDTLAVEMCWPLYHNWATVNMDNIYMSTICAVHLCDKDVYCRGKVRSLRRFVPKSIIFMSAEAHMLPRGTHQNGINTDHSMVWLMIRLSILSALLTALKSYMHEGGYRRTRATLVYQL